MDDIEIKRYQMIISQDGSELNKLNRTIKPNMEKILIANYCNYKEIKHCEEC